MVRSAVVVMLSVAAVVVATNVLVVWTARSVRDRGRKERPRPADVAIVLGAYTDGFRPSPTLTARLKAGLHLYRIGYVSHIIVSGGRGEDETVTESSSMKRFLVLNGVPAESVSEDRKSRDTFENLRNSRTLMKKKDFQQSIIVTSDYHLPRALAVARQLEMEVTGFPAPSRPSDARFAVREVFALLAYTLQGHVSWNKL